MEPIMIRSSVILFGEIGVKPFGDIQLCSDFLKLTLEEPDGKNLELRMSFKQIQSVELVNHEEQRGSGLVFYITDYMCKKIQDCLQINNNRFLNYHLYSKYPSENPFFVIDILNSDYLTMHNIRAVLQKSEQFKRLHSIGLYNKKNVQSFPIQFLRIISSNQWETLLGTMGKSIKCKKRKSEQAGMQCPYVYGQIIAHKPKEVITIKSDGSKILHKIMSPTSIETESDHSVMDLDDNDNQQASGSNFSFLNENYAKESAANSQLTPEFPYFGFSKAMNERVSNIDNRDVCNNVNGEKSMNHSLITDEGGTFYNGSETSFDSMWSSPIAGAGPSIAAKAFAVTSQSSQLTPRTVAINRSVAAHSTITPTSSKNDSFTKGKEAERNNNGISYHPDNKTKKIISPKKREIELDDDSNVAESKTSKEFRYPNEGRNSVTVTFTDLKYLGRRYMLNDTIIEFYLKYIHNCLVPVERRDKVYIFTTFFYSRLTQAPPNGRPNVTPATRHKRLRDNYQSLKSWTKKIDIFSMDYIIVPICEDIHWFLAIVVNPYAGIKTLKAETPSDSPVQNSTNQTDGPFLILLDSLVDPFDDKDNLIKDNLAEYLYLEYSHKKKDEKCYFERRSLNIVVPASIPQQKNYIDCGVFLLQFAELFLKTPPRTIAQNSSFQKWYPKFQIKNKRYAIQNTIMLVAPSVKKSDFIFRLPKKNRNSKRQRRSVQESNLGDEEARERRNSDSAIDDIKKDDLYTINIPRYRSLDSIRVPFEKLGILPTVADIRRKYKAKSTQATK